MRLAANKAGTLDVAFQKRVSVECSRGRPFGAGIGTNKQETSMYYSKNFLQFCDGSVGSGDTIVL